MLNPEGLTPATRRSVFLCSTLFLAVLLVPALHSWLTRDARFGWQMFAHLVQYRVRYYWVKQDGSLVRYKPRHRLRRLAFRQLAPVRRKPQARPHDPIELNYKHASGYDVDYVRAIVVGYCRYEAARNHNPAYKAFGAQVRYRRDYGRRHTMSIQARTP